MRGTEADSEVPSFFLYLFSPLPDRVSGLSASFPVIPLPEAFSLC